MAITFGPFVLDLDRRQLFRGETAVHLSPKAFDLLTLLTDERPRAITKADLQRRLWPGTFVSEANLSNLVAEIRSSLGDDRHSSRYIRTVHGFGYAFCTPAATASAVLDSAADVAPCHLELNGRWFPLSPGEHVVGRDLAAAVRLQHSTVSRRHARLVVTAHRTILEDFASKNGTFHDGVRVTAPVELVDGDVIRFGSVVATFHAPAALATTATAPDART